MGNNQSQDSDGDADGVPKFPAKSSAEIRAEIFLPDIPKQETASDSDSEPPAVPQHHPIVRRVSSQRGYHPRSASLRRMRSIQRRRILEGAQVKNKPPAKISSKMEAESKKIQEQKALLAASARGDLKKVEQLVDSGVDVNSSDRSQMSALHYAAMHSREEVIKSLIARGADVNATDLKGGFTALHWVIINAVPRSSSIDHLEQSLTALARAGGKVNSTDFNFATPLHIAAQKGNRDAARVLLKLGAQPDKVDITGRNCYEVAKKEQFISFMRNLVEEKSSSKDNQQKKDTSVYHVLEVPHPKTPAPTATPPPPPRIPAPLPPTATAPPPTTPAPLPPIPPPRLVYAGRSSSRDHIYNTPEFTSPPGSPIRLSSETPPPPPPRRRCQYPECTIDSNIYHVLDSIPAKKKTGPKRSSSPPRRRKDHKHISH